MGFYVQYSAKFFQVFNFTNLQPFAEQKICFHVLTERTLMDNIPRARLPNPQEALSKGIPSNYPLLC